MTELICPQPRVDALGASLSLAADSVAQRGRAHWALGFCDTAKSTSVRLEEDWCLFESPLGNKRVTANRALAMLSQNASLPSMLSLGMDPRTAKPILGGEVLVDKNDSPAADAYEAVGRVCADIRQVLSVPEPVESQGNDAVVDPLGGEPLRASDEAGAAVLTVGRSTAWALHERANGELAATLAVPGSYCQVQAYASGVGGLRLSLALELPPAPAKRCHQAIRLFLLAATRVVRMARAVAVQQAQSTNYRWEVVWPEIPTACQLDCGLTALSVAARMTSREMQALCDESLAAEFLGVRGWSSRQRRSSKR